MPSDLPTSTEPPVPVMLSEVLPPPKPRTTFQIFARRMSGRTTDLLAIAVVLIGSLTLGRQMLQWWQADPPAVLDFGPLENASTEWGANQQLVSLEFGDSPVSLTRQTITRGGQQAALDAIHERCQKVLVAAELPENPPDKSELEQLDALQDLKPDREQPGQWQLFTIGGEMSMVIGVRTFAGKPGKLGRSSPPESRRVLCWGLIFPLVSKDAWTAYTFVRRPSAGQHVGSTKGFELSQVALPLDCHRTVLMQEAGQTGLLGFEGPVQAATCEKHFNAWFLARGWTAEKRSSLGETRLQQEDKGWSARFIRRESGRIDDSTIEVQFHPQKTGRGIGLIHWLPGRESRPAAPLPSEGTP